MNIQSCHSKNTHPTFLQNVQYKLQNKIHCGCNILLPNSTFAWQTNLQFELAYIIKHSSFYFC